MKLETVEVRLYKNFVAPQSIDVEEDVTCLVGKNESGKTTVLKALHRLNPANGTDLEFDLTREYPRWRLAPDRRKNPNLDETRPVTAKFSLTPQDRAVLEEVFGVKLPERSVCSAARTYSNKRLACLQCSLKEAAELVASETTLDPDDLAKLPLNRGLAEVLTTAEEFAKEHRDAGETERAKSLVAFANGLAKYAGLITGDDVTEDQAAALLERLPKFFYFSNYDTLPGDANLTDLSRRISEHKPLDPRDRTLVALLAHAGEAPSDFLDDNYDSRKAELQAASVDLSRRVFKYWRQNPELTVVFDTDNRVIRTDPQGTPTAHRFLKIELRDGRHGDVETNFETRSAGFQWFFSFFAAFSEYQDSDDDMIVLLDEPGTSLHGDAQREFVEYIFNELGSSKQTIYTTHSQHMVDPTRYEKLRAVHDRATREDPDRGVVVTRPDLSADRATILPLESALGYSVSQHLFLGSGRHLAVEGSSDFVFLQRMTEYLVSQSKTGLDPRLAIVPVGSADIIPAFVALLGRRLKVSVLIDGSRSSAHLARTISAARHNSVPESSIIVCSDVPGAPTNADIEDMFTVEDYLRLYNWAFLTSVMAADLPSTSEPILKKMTKYLDGAAFDHALPAHALTSHRAEFFASVQQKTVSNFAALFSLLNATL